MTSRNKLFCLFEDDRIAIYSITTYTKQKYRGVFLLTFRVIVDVKQVYDVKTALSRSLDTMNDIFHNFVQTTFIKILLGILRNPQQTE